MPVARVFQPVPGCANDTIRHGLKTRATTMKARQLFFLTLILLIFSIFLGWPIVQVVRVGLAPSYLAAVFKDESLRQGLLNSLAIAVLVTLLCLAISIPLAVLSVRYDFRGKGI